MKNYTITVNGNVYDVSVEEKGGSSSAGTPAASPAPKAAPKKAAPAGGAGSIQPKCLQILQTKIGVWIKF